jgi:hypothetical protein
LILSITDEDYFRKMHTELDIYVFITYLQSM